jgi:hypothetical protein
MDSDPRSAAPRRKFTPEEDIQLRSLVERLGTKHWEKISRLLPDRTARQCRNRYKNYLLDSLVTNPWTPEEDALLIEKFHQIGPKWVEIGKVISGRSGNNVKNRWYKHLCKSDIGGRPKEGEREGMNLAEAIGWNESEWSDLFGNGETGLQYNEKWFGGPSNGDPLF